MNAFLRITAVIVALGNWYALTVGSSPAVLASYDGSELIATLFVPALLGLAAAEIAVRLAWKALRAGFLNRYAAMAATAWIGGMLCGVALAWGGVLHDEALGIVGTLGFGAAATLWGLICGMFLGFAEGLILGLPLAAALGLFGKRTTP